MLKCISHTQGVKVFVQKKKTQHRTQNNIEQHRQQPKLYTGVDRSRRHENRINRGVGKLF